MLARKAFCLPILLFGALSVQASDGLMPNETLLQRQADVVEAVGLVRHFHPHDAVEAVVSLSWPTAEMATGFKRATAVPSV